MVKENLQGKMEFIKEDGIKVQKKVSQNKYSQMTRFSLEYSRMTAKKELATMNGQMAHFMKACLRMTKCLVMEECISQMDQKYKENGRQIQSAEKGYKNLGMELFTWEILQKG